MADFSEMLRQGRQFTKCDMSVEGFVSDQSMKKPQPPLYKAPMRGSAVRLPRDFSSLPLKTDYAALVAARQSRRVYNGAGMSLEELSFLLWVAQGVKSIRGKGYATLRTVPSGGARHPFEAYFVANRVEGLAPGAYHYLPETHAVECLAPMENAFDTVTAMLSGQRWGAKADVVFFFSLVPYRAEWRYGIYAHRIVLMDIGHAGQALYMAAEALGFGSCGIGAFDQAACDGVFGLDGAEEYTVYAQPVGRYDKKDEPGERAFYAWLDADDPVEP